MRADRLLRVVLLLRRHGRMSASALARELEVSTRTVLRDMEALSAAGFPVYAERGRHGGFALLPGAHSELAGLTDAEALALLVAGSRRGAQVLGLGSPLASAVLKVADSLPGRLRAAAGAVQERVLVDPDTDLLERRVDAAEDLEPATLAAVRRAVLAGLRLRIRYAAVDQEPRWRTVDPVGLVSVRGHGYLLARRAGEERTYRLSRIEAAEVLDEPADRPERVDLARAWRERGARFRTGGDQVTVRLSVTAARRPQVVGTAVAVLSEEARDGPEDEVRLHVTFQDRRHAVWAVWQLGADGEVHSPRWLREHVHDRAAAVLARYS